MQPNSFKFFHLAAPAIAPDADPIGALIDGKMGEKSPARWLRREAAKPLAPPDVFEAAVEAALAAAQSGDLERVMVTLSRPRSPAPEVPMTVPVPRRLTAEETAQARRATVRALRLRADAADKAGDYIGGDALREWADSLARPRHPTPDYAWGMEPSHK